MINWIVDRVIGWVSALLKCSLRTGFIGASYGRSCAENDQRQGLYIPRIIWYLSQCIVHHYGHPPDATACSKVTLITVQQFTSISRLGHPTTLEPVNTNLWFKTESMSRTADCVPEVDTSTRDNALIAVFRLGINTPSRYSTLTHPSLHQFIRILNHFRCIRMRIASNGAVGCRMY
jgi:hypothetical protein